MNIKENVKDQSMRKKMGKNEANKKKYNIV